MKLLISGLTKFIFGAAIIGLMLFLPAGTINYFNGWLFLGLLFVPMLIMGIVMYIKSPDLLKKRLDSKEKRGAQKGVLAFSALMFPIGFVVSALDFRFGWSSVPFLGLYIACDLFLSGYVLYAEVMRENAYLSRKIEIQDGQKVVSHGLYSIVRHPMYFATLLMFLPIPVILGSLWGLFAFALYPVIIVIRIKDEEKLLISELSGYKEYTQKVKYRLIPFIW